MIGQVGLVAEIDADIHNGKFPHFCIFVGATGSGKKTLAAEVAKKLGVPVYVVDQGIDGVRTMIRDCYTVTSPVLYLIGDGVSLSSPAKNALLKIVEEPPNQAYIVMCLTTLEGTLETIKSRAVVYRMLHYTREEISKYLEFVYDKEVTPDLQRKVCDLCETPGEVQLLLADGVDTMEDAVVKLVDGVLVAEWANVFKAGELISLKKDAGGFDLGLFWKMFMTTCVRRLDDKSNAILYAKMVSVTSRFLRELGIRGISKQMLFDNWIVELRRI